MDQPTSPPKAKPPVYVPPIFHDKAVSKPQTACSSCPASLWFLDNRLHCFCGTMKTLTWTAGNEVGVKRCDGRRFAIAKLRRAEEGA